jgi:hypothetical protein
VNILDAIDDPKVFGPSGEQRAWRLHLLWQACGVFCERGIQPASNSMLQAIEKPFGLKPWHPPPSCGGTSQKHDKETAAANA